ncbi:hypothetical protein ISG10_38260 [Burkholderia pseudomallei]|nr:hypothetical protein [Burkholderia pseudomallei]MBF3605624.1 hypothetical protein [Burkholderia pseudomallei]MBF3913185.1 hypothetical protein [Burkholderia pseudomallei]
MVDDDVDSLFREIVDDGQALHAPAVGKRIDLPDFFGPFQSWRTASVASVEQYRCLNSSGVR